MKINRIISVIVLLASLAFLVACDDEVKNEIKTGSLSITVLDPNNVALPNVDITLYAEKEYIATTDASGKCYFDDLYTIKCVAYVAKEGYKSVYQDQFVSEGDNEMIILLDEQQEFLEDFESGSFSNELTFGGEAPWLISSTYAINGNYCAQAGDIDNYETSVMQLTYIVSSSPTTLSFWYRSQTDSYDHYFRFAVNGVYYLSNTGNYDWNYFEMTLPAGPNILTWTLDKEDYGYSTYGAWVDDIHIYEE